MSVAVFVNENGTCGTDPLRKRNYYMSLVLLGPHLGMFGPKASNRRGESNATYLYKYAFTENFTTLHGPFRLDGYDSLG